jgi:hypothetical protein
MQGMPTDPSPRLRRLRLPSSGSHVDVPAGDDVVDVKLNFGVAADGGDAEAATGGFDEADGVGLALLSSSPRHSSGQHDHPPPT